MQFLAVLELHFCLDRACRSARDDSLSPFQVFVSLFVCLEHIHGPGHAYGLFHSQEHLELFKALALQHISVSTPASQASWSVVFSNSYPLHWVTVTRTFACKCFQHHTTLALVRFQVSQGRQVF